MIAMGYPRDSEEYALVAANPIWSQEGLYSEASLLITTNNKNVQKEFTFRDAHPIDLSGFEATVETTGSGITCTATFGYTLFESKTVIS